MPDEDQSTEYTSELLSPSILGIYVCSFVLFYNETLEYYFTEEAEGEETKSEVMKVSYEPPVTKYNSTFEQLNEMLALYQEKDAGGEELASLIERYVKKEYMIQNYFKTI